MICFPGYISAIARIYEFIHEFIIEGSVRDFCESSLQQGLLFVLYLYNYIDAGRGEKRLQDTDFAQSEHFFNT